MQQEPLAAQPAAPSPRGSACFQQLFPLVFPFSRLFLGRGRCRCALGTSASGTEQRDPRHLGSDTATRWEAGTQENFISRESRAWAGISGWQSSARPVCSHRVGSCGLSVPRPGARSRAAGVGAAEAEAPCRGCDQPLSPRAPQWPPARRGGRSGSTLPEPWRCWESQPSTCGSCGAPGATRPLPRSPTMTTGTWSRSTERRARTSGTR